MVGKIALTKKRGTPFASVRRGALRFANFWYRELDAWVGTLLYMTLLLISLLPIANLHSSLLFNQKYADEVAARSQQRSLLNSLTAAFGLAALYHGVVGAIKATRDFARRLADVRPARVR